MRTLTLFTAAATLLAGCETRSDHPPSTADAAESRPVGTADSGETTASAEVELEKLILAAPAMEVGIITARPVLFSPTELRVYLSAGNEPRPAGHVSGTARVPPDAEHYLPLRPAPRGRYLVTELPAAVTPPVSVSLILTTGSGETSSSTLELNEAMPTSP